jgi:hypothetical protein
LSAQNAWGPRDPQGPWGPEAMRPRVPGAQGPKDPSAKNEHVTHRYLGEPRGLKFKHLLKLFRCWGLVVLPRWCKGWWCKGHCQRRMHGAQGPPDGPWAQVPRAHGPKRPERTCHTQLSRTAAGPNIYKNRKCFAFVNLMV